MVPRIVLRGVVIKPDAVIDRETTVHLPVVLRVRLGVVVEHASFDQLRLLQVLAEHAERSIGITEAGVEGVVRVVAVPEPSTWMGGVIGFVGFAYWQRRRFARMFASRVKANSVAAL